MNQDPSTSPLPPGLLRPVAIILMILGAAGFLAATIWYSEQVLCQLGATVVVFAGLGLVFYARRQAGPERPQGAGPQRFQGGSSRRSDNRQEMKERVMQQRTPVERRDAPDMDRVGEGEAFAPQVEPVNMGGLAGEVLAVYERKGAYVRVDGSRAGRSIVRATLTDGTRTTVLVLEGEHEVDLAETRALFALVNEHASSRGYLVARGLVSDRARAWADTRGLKLLSQGELWKLGLT